MTASINQKQVDKIQRKAGKQFDIKRTDKDEKEKFFRQKVLPTLLRIKAAILRIEKDNPGRGECFCVMSGVPYILDRYNGRVVRSDYIAFHMDELERDSENSTHKPVEIYGNRKYYLSINCNFDEIEASPTNVIDDGLTMDGSVLESTIPAASAKFDDHK